jgi:hypothetical protein
VGSSVGGKCSVSINSHGLSRNPICVQDSTSNRDIARYWSLSRHYLKYQYSLEFDGEELDACHETVAAIEEQDRHVVEAIKKKVCQASMNVFTVEEVGQRIWWRAGIVIRDSTSNLFGVGLPRNSHSTHCTDVALTIFPSHPCL